MLDRNCSPQPNVLDLCFALVAQNFGTAGQKRVSTNSLEKSAESGKTWQQELAEEVAALTAELTQAREQIASQEFVLGEKDLDLATKDKELVSWAVEAARMQQEIEWECEERGMAQAEAAETVKRRAEAEKVAAEAQAALGRAESVRKFFMESRIRKIVAKIFASDDYVSDVAELVPKLQETSRVMLLQELQAEYLPG